MVFRLLIAAAGILLLAQLCLLLVRYLRSPLKAVPGPFLARITNAWYFWAVKRADFEVVNVELHRKHGPIVRYGPNRYSISNPEASRIIYGPGGNLAKSTWYLAWATPGQWTLFTDQHNARHSKNRRLYQAMYSMSSLVHYESYVDTCVDIFVQRLSEMAQSSMPVNMGHWFQCYAFDVIGMITFAKRFGFLDRGEDVGGVIGALEDFLYYASLTGIFPHLHPYLFYVRNLLAGAKGAARAYVMGFTSERMREHQVAPKAVQTGEDGPGITEDFLTKFLNHNARDPDRFTTYHVLMACSQNVLAGSDTTAISLSSILYHLLKYPECMKKLRDEIDHFAAEGALSKMPTFKEASQMPYFQAVIKEALRMHPASGLPLERVVPEGGATIAGQYFPRGTIVGINSWVEHRDARYFGPDPDTFRPERWLDEDTDKLSIMNRHWMPFGLGPRTCIGRHISMLEMSKLIPLILRDFDFALDGPISQPWEAASYWFVKPKNFKVRIMPRKVEKA
ncbi:cytochrome P450 [Dactylonectria estremocensis]|uniref:Cytochrome P450 n=1 Tax=Dactylonectria estremocensis TaxID=1079267 RepID=A0A9P9D314_9HYPO|nr:cytochrome P450 [Dactylonectria estremocensis]